MRRLLRKLIVTVADFPQPSFFGPQLLQLGGEGGTCGQGDEKKAPGSFF